MPKLAPQPMYEANGIRVFHGNCVDLLPLLGQYAFTFADPPFNIGQDYTGFVDKMNELAYEQFTCEWIGMAVDACGGVLALHGPDQLIYSYLKVERDVGLQCIAWINWHYRFGQCNRHNWIDARCHCIIYDCTEEGNEYTWNADAVLVASDRVAYGDKRVQSTERGGLRLPGTIWGVPSDGPNWGRVQGNNEERRTGHPNQLPELYLARLVKAYTNAGDRVCDPFGGSGTTAVVCQALGRRCDTIDVSLENCQSIVERLKKGAVRV